jgi:hypothetical protein
LIGWISFERWPPRRELAMARRAISGDDRAMTTAGRFATGSEWISRMVR